MDDQDDHRSAAQASSLRTQAAEAGLRFEAYLPPDMALWILDKIEQGVFANPSEAVFVMLREFRGLEPHADLRGEAMNRTIMAAVDDPRPVIPQDEVSARLLTRLAEPRPEPALWRTDR